MRYLWTQFVVNMMLNPLTGVGAKLRPERVVCSKNITLDRAMLFVNVPADREKVSLPHGIFFEVKKCTLLCSTSVVSWAIPLNQEG